jgi:hypothetical protein
LSDCACGAPDAGAICPRGADAAEGLPPGILQNFALLFRNGQQAPQPLRPPACAQVELRLDQPAAIGGPVPGTLQNLALTSRHHPHALQPLRPPAGAQVEHRWSQRAISEGRHLGCCVCCAPGADAVCASAADGSMNRSRCTMLTRAAPGRAGDKPYATGNPRRCRPNHRAMLELIAAPALLPAQLSEREAPLRVHSQRGMAREASEGPSALPSRGLIRQFCHSPDRGWFASRLWESTPQENSRTFIPTAAAGPPLVSKPDEELCV